MNNKRLKIPAFKTLALALALASLFALAQAQGKKKPASKAPAKQVNAVAKSKADLIEATQAYKAELEKLLVFFETDLKNATETLEKRKDFLRQQLISKRELEDSEAKVASAQLKVNDVKNQMAQADNLVAEAKAAEQMAKLPPIRRGGYQTTAALIRYNGPAGWALANAAQVQGFFLTRFGRQLPISAFGQTAVHDRLGFDHRNSIDVAVHPDSAEGQALMGYLRNAGIPFLAFRHAIAGSATGAHFHIGYPSRRIAR